MESFPPVKSLGYLDLFLSALLLGKFFSQCLLFCPQLLYIIFPSAAFRLSVLSLVFFNDDIFFLCINGWQ